MFNEYPYVNLQDINLDWILKHIKDLETNLKDFIKINTIKYADPIIWNITTQYEANTVVVDGNTGTAYLSVAPVPSGVALTNTDYWTPIFTLSLMSANQNITFRDDGTNVIATFESDEGDWLLWNFYLYRVTQHIGINTAYVEGFNIERFSVELFIRDYIATVLDMIGDLNDLNTPVGTNLVLAINSILTDIIGDLDDLDTTDQTSIVNAINEIISDLGALTDLNTVNKTSFVNSINELVNNDTFVNPASYGAKGDGVTDDTAALQLALNAKNVALTPGSTYLITDALNVPADRIILGNGATIKIYDGGLSCIESGVADKAVFVIKNADNVKIDNVTFDLNGSSLGVYSDVTLLVNTGIIIETSSNIAVYNCRFINAYTECIWVHQNSGNIDICNNYFKHIYQEQGLRKMSVYCVTGRSGSMKVNHNYFDEDDIAPVYGAGAVFFANISNAECNYNYVKNCGRSNLYGHPVSAICCYEVCENITVEGNYMHTVESFFRMDACRNIRFCKNVCIYDKSNYYSDSDFIRFAYRTTSVFSWWGNCVIEDNEINIVTTAGGDAGPIGIYNDYPSVPARGFYIRNNRILNRNSKAIFIGENISKVNIENNHIIGSTSNGNILVGATGINNVIIIGNIIDYGSILIRNSGSSTVDMYDVIVANNRIYATSTDSITVQNAANVDVYDNDMSGKSFYMANASCGNIFVHDNNLHDSGDSYSFIGTNALQHHNYRDGVLVTSFT